MPENSIIVFTCCCHNQIITILNRVFILFKNQGYSFAFQNKICSIGRSDWASRYDYSRCCLIGLGHYDTRNCRCLLKNNEYGSDNRVMWCHLDYFRTIMNVLFSQKSKKQQSNALSFYRSQNVLGWSKFFVPDQKFIYILWQSQIFCARQKDDLHSVKLVFVPEQKVLKRH